MFSQQKIFSCLRLTNPPNEVWNGSEIPTQKSRARLRKILPSQLRLGAAHNSGALAPRRDSGKLQTPWHRLKARARKAKGTKCRVRALHATIVSYTNRNVPPIHRRSNCELIKHSGGVL